MALRCDPGEGQLSPRGEGGGVLALCLSYLFRLSVNAAKVFEEVDDLRVELELLFRVLRVAAGEHGADDREEEEKANV